MINNIIYLLLQSTFVAFVILLLFRFRKTIGLGGLYACLGFFQFVQVVFASNIAFQETYLVSPNTILFISTLFALLIIYIKEDASEAKIIIYALLIVNILVSALLPLFGLQFDELTNLGPNSFTSTFLNTSSWILFTGTLIFFLDALLIIILYEFFAKIIKPLFLQIFITMLVVISFDTICFTTIAFWDFEILTSLTKTNLIARGSLILYYSVLFCLYLKYLDFSDKKTIIKVNDIFKPLSFKQKFNAAIKEIEKSEEMFRLITDNSKDIICLLNLDSTYKYVSPSIKRVLGYEPSEFIGQTIFKIVHKDDIEDLKEKIDLNFFTEDNNSYTFRLLHKKGHYVYIEFTTSFIYKDGEIINIITSAKDVTEREIANNNFKTSLKLLEKREKAIEEISRVGKIGFIEFNNETNNFIWSKNAYKIFGLKPEDKTLTEQELLSLYDSESQKLILENVKKLKLNGTPFTIDVKATKPNNEEVWLRLKLEPTYNEQDEIIGRRGTIKDITEFKTAELVLEKTKIKVKNSLNLLAKKDSSLKNLGKIAGIGFAEYDYKTDKFIPHTDYIYTILGLTNNNKIELQEELMTFLDKESKITYTKALEDFKTKGINYDIELRGTNFQNKEFWMRSVSSAIYNSKNEIVGRNLIILDIKPYKITEQKLINSQKELQKTVELLESKEFSLKETSKIAKIGYWEYNIKNDSFTWSDYVYKIYALDPNKKIPSRKEMVTFYDKESQIKLEQATKNLNENGIPYDIELKLINKNNEEIWIRIIAQLVYDDNNNVIARRGVLNNITEAKKTQLEIEKSHKKVLKSLEELEKSEFAKNEASKLAKIGFYETDLKTGAIFSSDYQNKIFGLDPKEPLPPTDELFTLFDEESQKKLFEAHKNLLENGKPYDLELKLTNYKNKEVWIRNIVHAVYNDNNEIIKRRGITQNITTQKLRQIEIDAQNKELKKLNSYLNEVQGLGHLGSWEYILETNTLTWSKELFRIFDLSDKLKPPKYADQKPLYTASSFKLLDKAVIDCAENGTPYNLELDIITSKGTKKHIISRGRALKDNNNVFGFYGTMQDITESKKAQLKLENSNKKIKESLLLLEKSKFSMDEASKVAKIGYFDYHEASDTFFWSDYLYKMFELDSTKPVPSRKEILKYFDKDSQKRMKKAAENLILNGKPYDIEIRIVTPKNKEIWFRNVAQPYYNEKNEIIGRRGVALNITKTKKAQIVVDKQNDKLNKLNSDLNEAQKLGHLGSWEYIIETDTVIWSKELFRIFDLSDKLKAPKYADQKPLYSARSFKLLDKAVTDCVENGTPYNLELDIITSKGTIKHIISRGRVLKDNNNNIIGCFGTAQDITKSKKTQLKLEETNLQIKNSLTILEKQDFSIKESSRIAKIGYVEYNNITEKHTWSDYTYTIFGLKPTDKIPSTDIIINFFDNKSQEKLKKVFNDIIEKGFSKDIELKGKNKNNETFWIRLVIQPVYNDQNILIGRRALLQDITALKNNQIILENNNKKIQDALEELEISEFNKNEASFVAKIGFHDYNNEDDSFTWSDYMFDIFGLNRNVKIPPREVLVSLFDSKSKLKLNEATLNLIKNGEPYDLELKLTNFKKEVIWIRMTNEPVYNKLFEVIGRRGIAQNITERKKIEEENLKISKEYFKLFDNATISIWNEDITLMYKEIEKLKQKNISDIVSFLEQNPNELSILIDSVKINYVNKATLKLYKAQNQQDLIKNINITFGEGADKVFIKLIEAIYNNNDSFTSEVNCKTLTGEQFAAILSITIPKTLEEQKAVPVSIQSIQNIKNVEIALKESIKELRKAQKLGRLGSFEVDPINFDFKWSEEIYHIYGFDPKKGKPSYEEVLATIHPDNREYHDLKIHEAINLGIPFDIELKIVTPDKVEKIVRTICELIKDEEGKVILVKGVNQDITEQKRILNEIEKTKEMYRLVTENSNDIICLHDVDGNFKYISPAIHNLLGYDRNEDLLTQVFSVIHYDDINSIKEFINERMNSTTHDKAITFRARHVKGHFIWLEALTSPAYVEENGVTYFVSIARDVTQWTLAKQEVENYQKSLQELTTEITLIEEKQKKEIATNIHDHLSQSLVISNMKINELKRNPELKIIDEDLNFIGSHISDALDKSRKITYELSPPVLYQLGIIEALYWLLDDVEAKHKIKYEIKLNTESVKLDDTKSIILFRCIQEVINNAIKYSKASMILLDIKKINNGLDIYIKDNGVGFNKKVLESHNNHTGSGFGLFAVKERIKNIKGTFIITSKIGNGTIVKFFIPI